MSKILDWIKKHIGQTILIGFGLFFVPLILVHVAYRITAISPWFASVWEAGELITYIAGFEAFLGTIALGVATVYLNELSVDMNKDLLSYEKKRDIYDRTPTIRVTAGEMIPVKMSNLEEMDMPYYSYAEIYNTRGRSTIVQNKEIYVQRFSLLSSSHCDIQAQVNDLHLVIFNINGEDIAINYKKTPEQNFPTVFLIHSDPYEFCFIHNNLIPEAYPDILGELCLTLSNFACDQFLLCIKFKMTLIYSGKKISSSKLKIIEYSTNPIL